MSEEESQKVSYPRRRKEIGNQRGGTDLSKGSQQSPPSEGKSSKKTYH